MIMKNKSNISLATEIIKTEITALTRTLKRIDSSFDRACELIKKNSGKVVTIGLGKSGYIAMKMAATLSSTGTPSIFIHATEALHGDMGVINSNDIIIFYSNSGDTEEIVKLVPLLKVLKCKIISITGNKKSQLAKYSDLVLDASVTKEACPNNLAPTSSVMCALAISDALALTVSSKKNFTMKDFAKTHPEGSLGKRLLKNVQDIMIKKNIPKRHQGPPKLLTGNNEREIEVRSGFIMSEILAQRKEHEEIAKAYKARCQQREMEEHYKREQLEAKLTAKARQR